MAIERMDHFTILTRDAEATAKFYADMLGFEKGDRPNFPFPGVWMWSGGKPILHVIQRPDIPEGTGVLDHMAFWGTGLAGYIEKLKARNLKYDLRRLPAGGFGAGTWQLFFHDPNGARVEIDLDAGEVAPDGA
ncbi:MAG: VOC family protein [Hyphomicrobiaceae bacterium]